MGNSGLRHSSVHSVLACLVVALHEVSLQAEMDRNFVLPGQEVHSNTMRIIALGTGTPSISRDQAATCYLIQLGKQRNILFDVGTGSIANLYATKVDLATMDTVGGRSVYGSLSPLSCKTSPVSEVQVFLSHLHSDHITDLGPLYALTNNRTRPLTIFGPSGEEPETGTAAMAEGLRQVPVYAQLVMTRAVCISLQL